MAADLLKIERFLDVLLRTAEIADYPNALNGLQAENGGVITKVAAAVDAREETIGAAVEQGANLLLVHHGLFWGGALPLRGAQRSRFRAIIDGDLAVYSSHLPLDAHPDLGNNVLLAAELGLVPSAGFGRFKGIDIGVRGETVVRTGELIERAAAFASQWGGAVRSSRITDDRVTRRWAIVTGAGGSTETLREAHALGVDTLIAGEGPHHTAIDADELGIAVLYAGHYATETPGVRALAQQVSEAFGIPWTFVHVPTGL
ncbi:MAG: Nif3-like dinuclear metal center hexameric protein [Candidatus Eremiobacteraeota bacterium]|nr:Nif3-like dinuclear metal center hexameric protein [Candidatus Eremiobacteraeota bacterium]